jgi:hypothetical protein
MSDNAALRTIIPQSQKASNNNVPVAQSSSTQCSLHRGVMQTLCLFHYLPVAAGLVRQVWELGLMF